MADSVCSTLYVGISNSRFVLAHARFDRNRRRLEGARTSKGSAKRACRVNFAQEGLQIVLAPFAPSLKCVAHVKKRRNNNNNDPFRWHRRCVCIRRRDRCRSSEVQNRSAASVSVQARVFSNFLKWLRCHTFRIVLSIEYLPHRVYDMNKRDDSIHIIT